MSNRIKVRTARSRVPSRTPSAKWAIIGRAIFIVLAVAVCYLPVATAGFVWDDEQLITGNPLLRSLSGLGEIWTGSRTPDYFPVTSTLFWIEAHLFGQHALGYHLVNVFFHAANAVLFWRVLQRLNVPGAFFAALIFAVHPVHVESVAWISELKNVLSMFFFLASLLCFFEAEDGKILRRPLAYGCSLAAFVLALLSKTQVVFLPLVLTLCVWWRLRRRAGDSKRSTQSVRAQAEKFSDGLLWTLPFFLIALVFGVITIWFQNRGIGEEEIILGSFTRRLVNAGMACWWYAKQVIAPVRLMAVYPAWHFDRPKPSDWLPLIALLALFSVLWRWRNRGAAPFLFAFSYFVIALLPVLGLVRMAYARSGALVADHLQYFADLSLIALVAAGVAKLFESRRQLIRTSALAAAVLLTVGMATYSWARATVYHDEQSLWRDNLSKNPNAWQAHNRLGELFLKQNRFLEAAQHFQRAAELKPELAGNHNLLGLAYCRLERFDEGIAEYHKALQLKEAKASTANTSSTATIRINLANALTITGNNLSEGAAANKTQAMLRYQEAISQYEKALEIQPEHPAIHRNLGILLARLGRKDEAIAHLRKVLQYVPNEPVARETLDALEAGSP